ncbi:MAG: NADH-quinone oxidoreductase subunit M [Magnetococcales bacterium]|nr:NADH-quinone oxidoreductase subunit M [Magnetococcales bacterium]
MHPFTLLLLLPVIGAVAIGLLPRQADRLNSRGQIQLLALAASGSTLIAAWNVLLVFDTDSAGIQFIEKKVWQARMGSYYALGVDGLSMPMILLATLLFFVAVIASGAIRERVKSYYLALMLLETAVMGVFMAQDWSLFYIFWELTLIPLFFLISRWGGQNCHQAALAFVLYTMGGSVFLLISLLLAFDASPNHSFAMDEMMRGLQGLSTRNQVIIFIGFLIGFGVKMPVFPIHGWLPLAHVEAPSPVSILLSGILLKMGSYGLIRAATLLPGAVVALQPLLALLAVVTLLYGAVLAWRQSDLKAMIAYSSISHMGVVLLGIASLTAAGLLGAITQMVAHGLAAGSLFLLVGLLYQRTHSRDIHHYSSLIRIAPRFAFFIALAFMTAVALPGTAGFIAELHVLIGGMQRWGGWTALALGGAMLVGAGYSLRTVSQLFTGPVRPEMAHVTDLSWSEMSAASLLALLALLLGILPAPMLDLMMASVQQLETAWRGSL